jgi:Zn-finger nucleic acid-binding protein
MALQLKGFEPDHLKDLEALGSHMGDDDRKNFENLLTKNEKFARELVDGRLRQQDYDKKMNLSKEEVKKAKDDEKRMRDWYEENEPIHKDALEKVRLEREEKEKFKKDAEEKAAEVARLMEARGENVDQAALETYLKTEVAKYGFMTKAEMESASKEFIAKEAEAKANELIQKARTDWMSTSVPAMTHFAMDMSEIAYDHRSEFGEHLDRGALSKFMEENKFTEPKKAYDAFVRDRRDEKKFTQRLDEEVKKRMSGMGVPGATDYPGMGVMEKGALQQDVEKRQATVSGLDPAAAMAAARELREEGKV